MTRLPPSATVLGAIGTTLLALPLMACTAKENGSPQASGGSTTTTVSSGSPTTTSKPRSTTSTPSSPLDRIEPCDLLSAADRTSLGIPAGKQDDVVGSRGCNWTKSGDFGFSIGLLPDLGLKDGNYQGGTPTPIEIGKHEATKLENMGGGDGGCDIFIAITESSSVHLTVTASGLSDTPKACAKALLVAQIIDPKLP
ncbi:DUF3558 family protein [Actinokineospora sp.]|uniref:DUF3558 family protein n=1 Tax=Actinokineospora sp. TaxID=1872133 RepID=UPI004037AAAA